jgi:hypothetical protein
MRSLREQVADTCVHFNGAYLNAVCKAGVEYVKPFMPLPCHKSTPDPSFTCDHRLLPTEVEVQAQVDAWNRTEQRMTLVNQLVTEVRRAHGSEDWAGEVACPVCHGTLHLTHAKFNGHVWCSCDTQDCVSWVE